VAEIWNITKPPKDSGLSQQDQRVIHIGKSRIGREGESLIQTQHEDLTLSLVEAKRPEEMQTRAGTVAERIVNRLVTARRPMTKKELNADPLVGGSVAAIKKTLQRLVNRGIVEVVEATQRSSCKGGKKEFAYQALRGESSDVSRLSKNPSAGTDHERDTPIVESSCPIQDSEAGSHERDNSPGASECPIEEPSAEQGSGAKGTEDLCPRAGEKRSADEIAKLNDEAWNAWD